MTDKLNLWKYIAQIYKMRNDYEKAIKAYEKILEIREKILYGSKSKLLDELGYLYFLKGDYEIAIEIFKKVLSFGEEFRKTKKHTYNEHILTVWDHLSMSLIQNGEIKQGINAFKQIPYNDPWNEANWYKLGKLIKDNLKGEYDNVVNVFDSIYYKSNICGDFDWYKRSNNAYERAFEYFEKGFNQEDFKSKAQEVRITENEIEDYLYRNVKIIDEGISEIKRQVLSDAGKIDLLGKTIDNELIMIEIKKDVITPSAIGQIQAYLECLNYKTSKVRGELIGKTISGPAKYALKASKLKDKIRIRTFKELFKNLENKCKNCGYKNMITAKICTKCGEKL